MSDSLQQKFDNMRNDEAYKPFLRLLDDNVAPMVNTASTPNSKEMANAFLDIIKFLKEEREKGTDIRTSIKELSGGFNNPDISAKNVYQSNHDINIIKFIQKINDTIPSKTSEAIQVPVVLAVMTSQQSQELLNLTAFTDCATVLRDDFIQLRDHLDKKEFTEWQTRYGSTPEEWRPFGSRADALTINELIAEGFDAANKVAGFSPKLSPHCINIQNLKDKLNRFDLEQIRKRGSLMIVDIVSMRHPDIQRAYHSTMLDAYPNTSIVTIAPSTKCTGYCISVGCCNSDQDG